ncbi:MAG: sel1 repeat family protein [Algicola sp.]|nr:sel1 repeat family protein [Algicola sp.]
MKHPLSLFILAFSLVGSFSAVARDKHDKNYFCATDCQLEFKQFRDYALQGSPMANLMLAIMYYKGKGTEVNIEAGNARLRRAANAKEPAAQYQLGYLLMHGLYMQKNLEDALRWFIRAEHGGQNGAKQKIIEVKRLLNRELNEDDFESEIVDETFFAQSTKADLIQESQLADLQLCQVATNRKAAEVVLLFHDKGIVDVDEMHQYAVEWDMASWGKGADLRKAESAGVTMDWSCVKNAFIVRLSGMIDKNVALRDDEQFKAKYAGLALLDESLKRVARVRGELDKREAVARAKRENQRTDVDTRRIEVINVSAGFSYEQLLNVAKNQTCNTKCDPPWHYIVAPLVVLASEP